MSPFLYQKVFTGIAAAVAVIMALSRVSSPDNTIRRTGSQPWLPLAVSIFLTFWMGLRPVSAVFGDTVNYAMEYAGLNAHTVSMDWSGEWIWQWLMNGCKAVGLDIHAFFTIVAAGYVMSAFWAIKRLMPSDTLLGMVFMLNSLMFFTFGVNGLRNGLACHLVLARLRAKLQFARYCRRKLLKDGKAVFASVSKNVTPLPPPVRPEKTRPGREFPLPVRHRTGEDPRVKEVLRDASGTGRTATSFRLTTRDVPAVLLDSFGKTRLRWDKR